MAEVAFGGALAHAAAPEAASTRHTRTNPELNGKRISQILTR
jgi:hypothetical protein